MIDSLLNCLEKVIKLNRSEADMVTSFFKERTYQKGEFFLMEGQTCKHVAFVVRGLMRYYINFDGGEKTYAFSQENKFVCNYESFLPQSPSSKIIQALEDTSALVISYEDLQLFYTKVREGERFGRIVLGEVFVQILQELCSFYTDTPERRYEILKKPS